MPCPVDSSHTIKVEMMSAHIKICNATKMKLLLESQPYYSFNINSGRKDRRNEGEEIGLKDVDVDEDEEDEGEKISENGLSKELSATLSNFLETLTSVKDFFDKITMLYDKHIVTIPSSILTTPNLEKAIKDALDIGFFFI